MIENLLALVKENAGDAIINNSAISNDKNDLAVTTDFRDVYATVIEKVLKSPTEPTLGKWSGRISFL